MRAIFKSGHGASSSTALQGDASERRHTAPLLSTAITTTPSPTPTTTSSSTPPTTQPIVYPKRYHAWSQEEWSGWSTDEQGEPVMQKRSGKLR